MRILTIPRVFGYAFNPISVWCGYGPGAICARCCTRSRTPSGSTTRTLGGVEGADARHEFHKELFVSPFIDMDARYEFRLRGPGARVSLTVRETLPTGHVLDASLVARRRPVGRPRPLAGFLDAPDDGAQGHRWDPLGGVVVMEEGRPVPTARSSARPGVTVVTPSAATPVP